MFASLATSTMCVFVLVVRPSKYFKCLQLCDVCTVKYARGHNTCHCQHQQPTKTFENVLWSINLIYHLLLLKSKCPNRLCRTCKNSNNEKILCTLDIFVKMLISPSILNTNVTLSYRLRRE